MNKWKIDTWLFLFLILLVAFDTWMDWQEYRARKKGGA